MSKDSSITPKLSIPEVGLSVISMQRGCQGEENNLETMQN